MKYRASMLRVVALASLGLQSPAYAQETGNQETPEVPENTETAPADPEADAQAKKVTDLENEKKVVDAQKALEDSEKALLDSKASRATAAFGPLGSYQGAQGTTTVGESNRSVFETTLLAAQAIDAAADQMGQRLAVAVRMREQQRAQLTASSNGLVSSAPLIRPSQMSEPQLCDEARSIMLPVQPLTTARPVVIVSQSTGLSTELVDGFAVSTAAVAHQICDAMRSGEIKAGSLAAASAVVNTVANLLRTDYSVYGISLTPDQSLLTKRVALAFMNNRNANSLSNPVYLPDQMPFNLRDDRNPAVRRLHVMEMLRNAASQAAEGDNARKVAIEQAVDAYDKLRAALTTPANDKPAPISAIFRQASIASLLDQGGYLALTNIHMLGGTSYTKKNFFTSLVSMPYYVSGGGLTSYQVQEGFSGPLLDTITFHLTSGFHNVNGIHRNFSAKKR